MLKIKKINVLLLSLFIIPSNLFIGQELENTRNTKQEQKSIIDFETGYYHSGIIINTDNDQYGDEVWMWGYNQDGELGNITPEQYSNTPIKVEGLPEGNIINLELNEASSGVSIDIDNDGIADEIWVWGSNWADESSVGIGEVPIKLNLTPGNILDFEMSKYLNGGVILDVNKDGYGDEVWMWGNNLNGQIGTGETSYSVELDQTQATWVRGYPIDLELGYKNSAVIIDTNNNNNGDEVWMWGDNEFGQLGKETEENYSSVPVKVKGLPEGNNISYKYLNLGLIGETGIVINNELWMWGNNDYGQLGKETIGIDETIPSIVSNLPKGTITNFELGNGFASVIIDNELWTWGNNQIGQLGNGDHNNNYTPQKVNNLPNDKIKMISNGENVTGVVINSSNWDSDDHLFMWGNNRYGQLGNGTNTSSSSPIEISLSNLPNTQSKSWLTESTWGKTTLAFIIIFILFILIMISFIIYKMFKKG